MDGGRSKREEFHFCSIWDLDRRKKNWINSKKEETRLLLFGGAKIKHEGAGCGEGEEGWGGGIATK